MPYGTRVSSVDYKRFRRRGLFRFAGVGDAGCGGLTQNGGVRLAFEMVRPGLCVGWEKWKGRPYHAISQVDFPYIYDRALRLNPS